MNEGQGYRRLTTGGATRVRTSVRGNIARRAGWSRGVAWPSDL